MEEVTPTPNFGLEKSLVSTGWVSLCHRSILASRGQGSCHRRLTVCNALMKEGGGQVFGVPVEEVTSQLRSRAKAINFGSLSLSLPLPFSLPPPLSSCLSLSLSPSLPPSLPLSGMAWERQGHQLWVFLSLCIFIPLSHSFWFQVFLSSILENRRVFGKCLIHCTAGRIIYGQSATGLAKGLSISVEEAKATPYSFYVELSRQTPKPLNSQTSERSTLIPRP